MVSASGFVKRLERPHGTLPLFALATCALVACAEAKLDAEETLRRFLADGRNQRAEAAWAALSEESQRALLEKQVALARAAGTTPDLSPRRVLFEAFGLIVLDVPESIVVVSPPGREVTLRVSVKDGRSADVRLVRESAVWKIDLVGSLKRAPPLEAELRAGPADGAWSDTSTTP